MMSMITSLRRVSLYKTARFHLYVSSASRNTKDLYEGAKNGDIELVVECLSKSDTLQLKGL